MFTPAVRVMNLVAGEITCGYADGALTLEETIAVAFHRRQETSHKSTIPYGIGPASHVDYQLVCTWQNKSARNQWSLCDAAGCARSAASAAA